MTTIIPNLPPAPDIGAPSYEDATVYRSGVVLLPLPGHPEYQGIVRSAPGGPIARMQDGDLVLRIDLASIERWLTALGHARDELTSTAGSETTDQNPAGGMR